MLEGAGKDFCAGYDLTYYLKQNWSKIGRDLNGKITVWVGDMDNYFLNLGVYEMEKAFKELKGQATFGYGRPMKPHGWQPVSNAELVRYCLEHGLAE